MAKKSRESGPTLRAGKPSEATRKTRAEWDADWDAADLRFRAGFTDEALTAAVEARLRAAAEGA